MVELWEAICSEIQNNLAQEDDNTIFRILLPNFDQLISDKVPKTQAINSVIRFLKCLKALTRATNCVCLISVEEQLLD